MSDDQTTIDSRGTEIQYVKYEPTTDDPTEDLRCDGDGDIDYVEQIEPESADQLGWGPGWPHCQAGRMLTVVCGHGGLRLSVRREIGPLVARLVTDLEAARGRPFKPNQSGGFACRSIAGTKTASNHSWGLAIDLDAPSNPQASARVHQQPHPLRKTYPGGRVLRSDMPLDAERIADRYGFRWGGTYKTKPDPMHFEFMGSVADAVRRVDALAGHTHSYVVVSGDTLSKIGEKLGVDWHQLARDNQILPPRYVIRVGQVLRY